MTPHHKCIRLKGARSRPTAGFLTTLYCVRGVRCARAMVAEGMPCWERALSLHNARLLLAQVRSTVSQDIVAGHVAVPSLKKKSVLSKRGRTIDHLEPPSLVHLLGTAWVEAFSRIIWIFVFLVVGSTTNAIRPGAIVALAALLGRYFRDSRPTCERGAYFHSSTPANHILAHL